MIAFKKTAATTSAVAMAAAALTIGAGAATAQEGSAGELDLHGTERELQSAAEALNGPVTIAGNAEGGPTVTYENRTDNEQRCIGFVFPYSTLDEVGLKSYEIESDNQFETLDNLGRIDSVPGVSTLGAGFDGAPTAGETGGLFGSLEAHVTPFIADPILTGVRVAPGDTIEWTAPTPNEPSAGSVLCKDTGLAIDYESYTGTDPQVVADQINGYLPLDVVGAGSISGGSVGSGADAVGSLAGLTGAPPVEEDEGGFPGS